MKLNSKDMKRLFNHYSGNCFGCERCNFLGPIERGEPGAVEAYAAYMKENYNETIEPEPE